MLNLDLLKELKTISEVFEQVGNEIKTRENEINNLLDEQKRLQGEYRVIFKIAKQQGIIDDEGNEIKVDSAIKEQEVEVGE